MITIKTKTIEANAERLKEEIVRIFFALSKARQYVYVKEVARALKIKVSDEFLIIEHLTGNSDYITWKGKKDLIIAGIKTPEKPIGKYQKGDILRQGTHQIVIVDGPFFLYYERPSELNEEPKYIENHNGWLEIKKESDYDDFEKVNK